MPLRIISKINSHENAPKNLNNIKCSISLLLVNIQFAKWSLNPKKIGVQFWSPWPQIFLRLVGGLVEDIILDSSKMLKQFNDGLKTRTKQACMEIWSEYCIYSPNLFSEYISWHLQKKNYHWNVLNLELKPILGSLNLLFPELCQFVQAPVHTPILHGEDICQA